MSAHDRPRVAVLLKWAALRIDVDPRTGVVTQDPRRRGLTSMDEAALEWALRCGEAWGAEVVALTAGPTEAEGALRLALAAGAHRTIRVDLDPAEPSELVAGSLAEVLRELRPALVIAGAHGLARASGSVPAYVAHHLGAAQALGLVDLEIGEVGVVDALRRTDRGGRERVRALAPAVLSVEGATASLRRAGLIATLGAADRLIDVVTPVSVEPTSVVRLTEVTTRPYRPRAKAAPAPDGDDALARVVALTDAGTPRTPPRTLELDAVSAAEAILDQLGVWGLGPRAVDDDSR